MRELISLFRELIGKRKLVTELAKADFRKRFVGSYFGIVWMFDGSRLQNNFLCRFREFGLGSGDGFFAGIWLYPEFRGL